MPMPDMNRSISDNDCTRRGPARIFITLHFATLLCIHQFIQQNCCISATVVQVENAHSSTPLNVSVPSAYVERCTQIRQNLVVGMTKLSASAQEYLPVLTIVSLLLCPAGLPALPLSIAILWLRSRLYSIEPYPQLRAWSVTTGNIFLVDRVCSFLVVEPLLNPNAIYAFVTIARLAPRSSLLSWLPIVISTIVTSFQLLVLAPPFLQCVYHSKFGHLWFLHKRPKPLGFPSTVAFAKSTSPIQSLRHTSPITNSTQLEYPLVYNLAVDHDNRGSSLPAAPSESRSQLVSSLSDNSTSLPTPSSARPLSDFSRENALSSRPTM